MKSTFHSMSLDFNLKGVQGESPQSKQSFDLKKEWSEKFPTYLTHL